MRLKQRSTVDFPQPEGPINEVIMPSSIRRLTSKRAWKVPYHKLRSCVSMAYGEAAATAEADVGSLVEQRVEAGPQVVTLAGYTEPQHGVEGCRAGIHFLVGDATVGESLGEALQKDPPRVFGSTLTPARNFPAHAVPEVRENAHGGSAG